MLFLFLWGYSATSLLERIEQWSYPKKFETEVEYWSAKYGVDPLLVYAFIRTESNFDPKAQSDVDARGLMQITEETFEWLKSKIARDELLTFDDLYQPETNIRFGTYYIKCCLERYHYNIATVAAAYHSGYGTVDKLLKDDRYTTDGKTLTVFPYPKMNRYVLKITRYYKKYIELYSVIYR